MTTIHTIEDLVRLLDEHPQWLDAVRARVLTRELIELPQTLAKLSAGTQERFDKVDQRFDKFEAEVNQRFEKVDQRFDKVDQRLAEHDQRFDKVEASLEALRYDIAPLKGTHARNEAIREAGLIAEDMGFALVRVLDPEQIRALIQSQSTADIPANELRSFRRADLIMEVTDLEGSTCYVAVEVSFTANGRDTVRAIRNARFLTRFTGKRSEAAVVGLRRGDRIEESIESKEVFWYRLDRYDLQAE